MVHVLGISASLRNARFSVGLDTLAPELARLDNQTELEAYLGEQTKLRFDDFVAAGRAQKLPFDKIYANLRKLRSERGLSNSEAALAAALWAAMKEGASVRHLSLSTFFPMTGRGRNLDDLRQELLAADAILLSGPVYFGDRGSLAQSLIEFISADPEIRRACAGKIYGGLAVGAKRNGGQETTLIYQMLDFVNLDWLAVGNSSETTAQYGGTAVAGDVGKLHTDSYGIETCIGTGQRVARAAHLFELGRKPGAVLADPLRLQMWLLQDDKHGHGRTYFENWAAEVSGAAGDDAVIELLDVTREEVVRCIACDVCPIDVGDRDDYRCIITSKSDFFVRNHTKLLAADAVLLCSYSPENRANTISVYQQFIERTRYIRRDNYALADTLIAPFVISELSARQNLHLRMLTSGIRHHTVLHHPLIGMVYDGQLLAQERLVATGRDFVRRARELTLGRYRAGHPEDLTYNPIGYEISARKANEDAEAGRTSAAVRSAASVRSTDAKRRIAVN